MTYSRTHILLNIALFEAIWWSAVLSAGSDFSHWVFTASVLYVLMHLQWMESWQDALPLLLTVLMGYLFDQAGLHLGMLSFPGAADNSGLPLWMVAIWLAFATTLNVSFQWLRGRLRLAMWLGMVFGPMAYYGASRLGAVSFPHPYMSLLWLAIGWAVLMPALLHVRTGKYLVSVR